MKIEEPPYISVLMTAFNREKFIAEAIESVLASSYENFELIIVDDASSDSTVSIARTYEKLDNRVKVYTNELNLSQFPNRNKAASLAIGKYVKYVDSDDTIFPWTLEYCVEKMERYPLAGMGILYLKNNIRDEYLEPKDTIQKNFFESRILHIGPAGTILNKQLFERAGFFNTDYGVPSDMYFNLKMASLYPTVLLKKEFFFYRVHEGQEFNNRYSYLCYNYKYLSDVLHLPGFPLNEKQKKFILRKAEFYYVKDLIVYLKSSKNVKETMEALSISGMRFFNVLRGGINLVLMKCGLQKFRPVDQ
ncbi:MAG: glycosyltransferase family 2 protein [Bacteroidota bacterium]|nr:glycosyltransferase family 2 protein [Bacteroidota bacterium]